MANEFSLIHLGVLLEGFRWTILLSLVSLAGGGLLGFAIALLGVSRSPAVNAAVSGYVAVVQGSPVLILMFAIYFGLPLFGVEVSALVAASIAMIAFSSAFLGTIWRASLRSVPRTQWEAADCLALAGWQRLLFVILPQAIRIATPPTVGFMVQIIKNTSLASAIGVAEMTYVGKEVNASTFEPFTTYLVIAVLYFVVCFPLSAASRKLERKYRVAHR